MHIDSPLFGFLQTAARVTEELVLLTEHLTRRELTQARSHRSVLFYIDRQIQKQLIS